MDDFTRESSLVKNMMPSIFKSILLPMEEDEAESLVASPKIQLSNDSNHIVRSTWFGSELTNIQKLCIKSYLHHGHEFHLHTMNPVKGVPEGVIIKNATDLMSVNELRRFPSNSQASDYYRALMIYREGGWYVDLDTVCLKPLDFPELYVFASEESWGNWPDRKPYMPQYRASDEPTSYVSNHLFKAPARSPFLQYVIKRIKEMDTLKPKCWGAMGPEIFIEAVPKFELTQYVKAPIVLDWLNPKDYVNFVQGEAYWSFDVRSYSCHLRTSFWRPKNDMNLNPNGKYPDNSLFEVWKREYGVN